MACPQNGIASGAIPRLQSSLRCFAIPLRHAWAWVMRLYNLRQLGNDGRQIRTRWGQIEPDGATQSDAAAMPSKGPEGARWDWVEAVGTYGRYRNNPPTIQRDQMDWNANCRWDQIGTDWRHSQRCNKETNHPGATNVLPPTRRPHLHAKILHGPSSWNTLGDTNSRRRWYSE